MSFSHIDEIESLTRQLNAHKKIIQEHLSATKDYIDQANDELQEYIEQYNQAVEELVSIQNAVIEDVENKLEEDLDMDEDTREELEDVSRQWFLADPEELDTMDIRFRFEEIIDDLDLDNINDWLKPHGEWKDCWPVPEGDF